MSGGGLAPSSEEAGPLDALEVLVAVPSKSMPTGAELVGSLVTAFDVLRDKSARKMSAIKKLKGRSGRRARNTNATTPRETCAVIGSAALSLAGAPPCTCGQSHARPGPPTGPLSTGADPLGQLLNSFSLHLAVLAWDQRLRPRLAANPALLVPILRYAAVDLGFRLGVADVTASPDELEAGVAPTMSLGGLIDSARSRHATQAALAAELGVSENLVLRWKNGERRPRPCHLRALAEAAGHGVVVADRIRLHHGLSELRSNLAGSVGDPAVRETEAVLGEVRRCRIDTMGRITHEEQRLFMRFCLLSIAPWGFPRNHYVDEAWSHGGEAWARDVADVVDIVREGLAIDDDLQGTQLRLFEWHEAHRPASCRCDVRALPDEEVRGSRTARR